MELNHLQVFFEVAKIGSFMEAARKLHISQSALSRSVSLLEESQGILLFERSKRGVALTPIGTKVFEQAQKIFQTVQVIEELCQGSKQICAGPLKFASPDHVMNDLLIQPLHVFRQDYPQVIPSVSIGPPDEIIESVVAKKNEFALLFAKIPHPQITYKSLREDYMCLVIHEQLWNDNSKLSASSLVDRFGYISSVGAHTKGRRNTVAMEIFGKIPKIALEVDGQEAQKRVCLQKGGLAYLSRFMVEKELKEGVLKEVTIDDPHVFSLWLATRKEHQLTLPAQRFVERLEKSWS